MLALEEPRAISANNVLAAAVLALGGDGGSHADVQLACGATRLVARITRASAVRLGLAPGKSKSSPSSNRSPWTRPPRARVDTNLPRL